MVEKHPKSKIDIKTFQRLLSTRRDLSGQILLETSILDGRYTSFDADNSKNNFR